MTKKTRLYVAVGAGVAVATFLILKSSAPPREQIPFSTAPYVHNMGNGFFVYSGDFIVSPQQWGAFAVSATDTATWAVNKWMRSPVEDQKPGNTKQPVSLAKCGGDFFSSATSVGASPNTPKWVISTIGNFPHTGCTVERVFKTQVYGLSATGLSYVNQVFLEDIGVTPVVVGDMGYVQGGDGRWTPIDLNSCLTKPNQIGCDTGIPVSALPPHDVQTSIQGFTYTMSSAGSTLFMNRQGGPVATQTPSGPTAVPPPMTATAAPSCPTPACTCVPVQTVTAPPASTPTPTPPLVGPTRRPTASRTRSPIP